jgi:putative ABC transport system substrate-binding protein
VLLNHSRPAKPIEWVFWRLVERCRPGSLSSSEGLRALGYIEGQNLNIERRYAAGHLERLPDLAAELARMPVDVIVVAGPTPVRAAMSATTRIPIVMIVGSSDPVGEGLVKSLAHPGGNLTGLTYAVSTDRFGKQLELLKEAAPGISRIAVWWDMQMTIFHQSWAAPLEAAARKLGLQIQPPVQVLARDGVEGAFATMKQQRADAVLVSRRRTTRRGDRWREYRGRSSGTRPPQ